MKRKTKFNEKRLSKMFLRMFKCDAVFLTNPLGVQMFLILGFKQNTKKDVGQWYKNGSPIDFDYMSRRVIASGTTEAKLVASAREFKSLEGTLRLGRRK